MKKIVISSVVLFVVSMGLGFLIHGVLLLEAYQATGLMRPLEEQESRTLLMVLAHAMIAIGFTLIYRQGSGERAWLGQGLRFGLLWCLAAVVPMYLIYHVVMPMPRGLVLQQIGFDMMGVIAMGLIVAFINREPADAVASD